jgi:hypothetical protein
MKHVAVISFVIGSVVATAGTAEAQQLVAIAVSATPPASVFTQPKDAGPDVVEPRAEPPAPQPYASPFIGRSVNPGNGARFDMTNAPLTKDGTNGVATAMLVSGSYKITEAAAVGLKLGVDRVGMTGADTKVGFLNPSVSGMYAWRLGRSFRLATSLTTWLPLGSGGGNSGDPDLVTAHKAAALARSAVENATFGVNDFTVGYAVDFAYVDHGVTAQLGAQLTTGFRARGADVQSDAYKVNSTYGLGVGYFLVPELSLGAELRYQRYVSTPSAVEKDPTARQNLSAAGGVRTHFALGKGVWMRPGLSYGHGLVGPIEKNGYHLVQLDVPFSF